MMHPMTISARDPPPSIAQDSASSEQDYDF